MPLMTHPESGQKRIVPSRSRSSYEQRGWHVAGLTEPNVNDLKSDWVAYAQAQGIDTNGLTKDEIIDAVSA